MANEGGLLPAQPPPYRLPRDPVGTRPDGERPCGPVRLFWLVLVALRFHLWRVLQFVVLAMLVSIVYVVVVGITAGLLHKAGRELASYLVTVAAWPVLVPVLAGVSHALLLVLQKYRPPWYEAVRAFLSLRLYGHVLMAGLPAMALHWGTYFGLMLAGLDVWIGEMVGRGPWGTWLAGLPPLLLASLVNLPFQFAALDTVTTFSPFWRSLGRNLRFAGRDPGLLVTYGLFVFAFSAAMRLGATFARTEGPPDARLWFALAFFGVLAAGLVGITVMTLLHPVYYRELVWREREREASHGGHGP